MTAFIDFTGRAIPTVDAPALSNTFIPAYEKQGAVPEEPAPFKTPVQTVGRTATKENSNFGATPPVVLPSTQVVVTNTIPVGTQDVNNVKTPTLTPVAAENTKAVITEATK